LLGAVMRISVSRPRHLAHLTGRMPTTGLSVPRAAISTGIGTSKWRRQACSWTSPKAMTVGLQFAESVEHDEIGDS
jgi:hypothetical protein